MKKSIKKTLSIALFGLVISQSAAVSALPNTSDKNTSVVQKNKSLHKNFKLSSNHEDINKKTDVLTMTKDFFICENNYTDLPFGYCYKCGIGYIKFKERAEDFTLTFKNSTTGKVIFSEKYLLAGKRDENGDLQGVEKISFEIKMNGKDTYEIILSNHDGWPIQGEINLQLKDKQEVTLD